MTRGGAVGSAEDPKFSPSLQWCLSWGTWNGSNPAPPHDLPMNANGSKGWKSACAWGLLLSDCSWSPETTSGEAETHL